jgi:hypothetical protein
MTGKIVNVLYQTEYGPDEYTMEQVELLSKAADGVPAMFFVCRHKSPTTSITEVTWELTRRIGETWNP